MTAWFISDLHLKDINERSSIILLRFLQSLIEKKRECSHLFLLGDIFDLWVSDAPVFIRKFQAIVDSLAELKRNGVEIVYFEGNHDLYVKNFWEDQLGIPTYVDPHLFELGSYNIRLEHGDQINTNDLAYRRYRSVVRHPLMGFLAPIIAGKALNELGQMASQISRGFSSKERKSKQDELRKMIREHGMRIYKETPFDLIISGHMHVQDDFTFEVEGHKSRSINLGSWFDGAKALELRIAPQGLEAQFVELD